MNNVDKLIKERHSVREYLDKEIETEKVEKLNELIAKINKENDLHIKLILNDSEAFTKFFLSYGRLNAQNYLAMIGKKSSNIYERLGYYGEQIVLYAQELGLNTCWVSGTFSKKSVKAEVKPGEVLVCVIAIGYGKSPGVPRKSKTYADVSISPDGPDWYKKGIEYALLAPTAVNEQKFKFELKNDNVVALYPGKGIGNTKLDLGIVKYHFELGADPKNFYWQ